MYVVCTSTYVHAIVKTQNYQNFCPRVHNFEYGPCLIWINSIFPNAMDPNSRTNDSNSVRCHTPNKSQWIFFKHMDYTCDICGIHYELLSLLDVGCKLRPLDTPAGNKV